GKQRGDFEDLEGRRRRQAAIAAVAEEHRDVLVGLLVAGPQQEIGGGRGGVRKGAVGRELCPGCLEVDPVTEVLEGVEQWRGDVVDQRGWDMADLGVPLCGRSRASLLGQWQV